MIRVFAKTDVGRVRQGNEDNFLVLDTISDPGAPELPGIQEFAFSEFGLTLMVSDGMGGAAAGEVASILAVQTVKAVMQFAEAPIAEDYAEQLENALHTANSVITDYAEKHPLTAGMGATATTAGILRNTVFIGQVGDSRAYLIRGDRIEQLTKDQSYVNQLLEAGKITAEEAETHPRRNIILQALGNQESLDVALTTHEFQVNDFLMLCSDGLTNMIQDPEILKIVRVAEDVKMACHLLINLANERGGKDNITVVMAQFI